MSNYFHRQVEITLASSLRRKSVSQTYANHRLLYSMSLGQVNIASISPSLIYPYKVVRSSPKSTIRRKYVSGPLPRDMIAGTENIFEINMDTAGNVPLEIKITSPTGANGKRTSRVTNELYCLSLSSATENRRCIVSIDCEESSVHTHRDRRALFEREVRLGDRPQVDS